VEEEGREEQGTEGFIWKLNWGGKEEVPLHFFDTWGKSNKILLCPVCEEAV